jgi:two-component system sensor histidine kinase HydH
MKRLPVLTYAWPMLVLAGLLCGACLVSIWSINRLSLDLGRSLREDAAGLQAAQEMQVQLRHLRFHALMLAADSSPARRRLVDEDRAAFRAALAAYRPGGEAAEIEAGFDRYERQVLAADGGRAAFDSVPALVRWADAHPVGDLLVPCRRAAERSQERMAETLERSERQAALAGWLLLAVGLIGPAAGVVGGYVIARRVTGRVARLSVRVRAVRAHLDQEVGAVTVEEDGGFGDVDRELDAVVGRVRDVCRRVQEQERDLMRAEQLAAVGHLAAGVAHEVRNPLTGIKLLVDAALRPANPAPLTPADLTLIRAEIGRLERTAQDLLDFAKPARPAARPLELGPLVERAVAFARPRGEAKGVELRLRVLAQPLVAAVDPDQFSSLVSNLLNNAVEATPTGGPGESTRVEVADTGPGIDPAVAGRLFAPFVSTRPTGTGLGLSIARRIAEDHGGTLTAANRTGGNGATFTVALPATEGTHAETAGGG